MAKIAKTSAPATQDDAGDDLGRADGRGLGRNATPIDKRVGMRVRLRRKQIGLSAEELGQRLGIAQQQVQKYEIGANRISAARLFELASILNVPIDWFFATAEHALDADGAPRSDLDAKTKLTLPAPDEVAEVVRLFMSIDDPAIRANALSTLRILRKAAVNADDEPARRAS
jgi:transcriptional regulator with XRE-family HTH domain